MTFEAFPQRVIRTRMAAALTLAVCLLSAPVSRTQQALPADDSQAKVRQMIQHGLTVEALAELDALATRNPAPLYVPRLRGLALYSRGDLHGAEQAFAAALHQDPMDREALQMRGITLFRLGRPADAIPILESLRATPTEVSSPVDPAYVLALCYLDMRRYDDAREAFARQFGFARDSAQAYLLAARMLLRREYVPIAQQFARKAIELTPGLPLAHLLLGETQLAGNHLDEAIQEFLAERTLSPLEPSVYDRLGDAYVRRGDLELARQSLQEAILLEPSSTGPFILLGKVLLKQGDAAAATGYLEHARDMDPGNYMTHSLLGQCYRQASRMEDAHRETDTAQQLQSASDPNFAKSAGGKP